jgi:hypothetical protein
MCTTGHTPALKNLRDPLAIKAVISLIRTLPECSGFQFFAGYEGNPARISVSHLRTVP